jgi:orotate phosphoribosyltransferase
MPGMLTGVEAKSRLLSILREKSVFLGGVDLSSGARASYNVDCKLTTLDPVGAWLAGQVIYSLIQKEAEARRTEINAIGGLTIGADPIALAVGMYSFFVNDAPALRVFIVRKTPKGQGQAKSIEGNFERGDMVVVIGDIVTRNDSTIRVIKSVERAGGKVAFVAVLIDDQEGGRQKIEDLGHHFVSAFTRDELIGVDVLSTGGFRSCVNSTRIVLPSCALSHKCDSGRPVFPFN